MNRAEMDRVDKLEFWISSIFRLLVVIGGVVAILTGNWIHLGFFMYVLVVTFLPSMIEKKYRFEFPSEFEVLIMLYIYASLMLGEYGGYFEIFWWWDVFLHTFLGIIIASLGFILVYVLNSEHKVNLSPFFVALFSFSIAVAFGAIWEIFEYAMDVVFGLNMQTSGLVDTMWDLIVETLSALLVSTLGYLYLKKEIHVHLFEKAERKFIERNPHLFRK
ncbi:hypothetical protein [Methanococcoides burtonii]|uniref:DUF2238 domain-containing protein n=1 Tax=Methanococcoides burtonii (strain DSM 6242 / NBRC 107633 / OCM 468 / ACE-M) TaxID=259564 RepID=Q12Y19_METBU|nr:hypothetical protein [Methanococcoides burtonii]ABE51657.1 Hypothetical protein Mbur_0692 [Methanococcoides burtonii DSM 6242]